MKTQELVLICRYSEEGQTAAQIIGRSLAAFLRKELKNTENPLPPEVHNR